MQNPISLALVVAFAVGIGSCAAPGDAPSEVAQNCGHFHPKGKPPSQFTRAVFENAQQTPLFADRKDFEEQERGFIAGPDSGVIMADAGNVAWDIRLRSTDGRSSSLSWREARLRAS